MAHKRWIWLVAGAVAIIAAVLIRQSTGLREPRYQGRRLSLWLSAYDVQGAGVTHAEVNAAVRSAGTNALPLLLEMMESRDSRLKRIAIRFLPKGFTGRLALTAAETRRARALAGFRALGPSASVALPALVRIQGRENYAYVMSAIAGVGPESVVPLANDLTNAVKEIRRQAAYELGVVRPTGACSAIAIAALSKGLDDRDVDVRHTAPMSIGQIADSPEVAVPALVSALEREPDDRVKIALAFAVGRYGGRAAAAVPVLTRVSLEGSPEVRSKAASSLRRIVSEDKDRRNTTHSR